MANVLSLCGSLGTLVCCALPALLVALGAGTVVASVVSTLPWLAQLTQHKAWLFLLAGVFLVLNGFLVYRPGGQVACAINGGKACEEARRWNKRLLWVSVALYGVGVVMAYFALPLRQWLEG